MGKVTRDGDGEGGQKPQGCCPVSMDREDWCVGEPCLLLFWGGGKKEVEDSFSACGELMGRGLQLSGSTLYEACSAHQCLWFLFLSVELHQAESL